MCGVLLAEGSREAVSTAARPAPLVVNQISLLGLEEEPSGDAHYLLEEDDEEPSGRGRMYLALALLAIAAGVLFWQWRQNGYTWLMIAEEPRATSGATANPPASNATTAAPGAAADVKPAPTGAASVPDPAPTPAPNVAPDAQPAKATDSDPPISRNNAPAMKPRLNASYPAAHATSALSADPFVNPARLLAEGQNYLYGSGVPQNCGLAQKDLRTAADHANSVAESLLGTMYASGHCVARDLPTAYHWYARAFHDDSNNSRIQSDLEALWRQMTPAERQLASRTGQ